MPDNFGMNTDTEKWEEAVVEEEGLTNEEAKNLNFNESVEKEVLNIIYLLDISSSMNLQGRIDQLNVAMAEAVAIAQEKAAALQIDLTMRFIEFGSTAEFILGTDEAHGLSQLDSWPPLKANGTTNTAQAIRLARSVMHTKYLGTKSCMPIVIQISDGGSDNEAETLAACEELRKSIKRRHNPDADVIIRVAIGVHDYKRSELEAFASTGNIVYGDGTVEEGVKLVLEATDIQNLGELLRVVTVSSLVSATKADEDVLPEIRMNVDEDWTE